MTTQRSVRTAVDSRDSDGPVIGQICRPHDAVPGAIDGIDGFHEIDRTVSSQAASGLIVYRFDAPLFYANAPHFLGKVRELIAIADPRLDCFLLDAETIASIDTTTAAAMLGHAPKWRTNVIGPLGASTQSAPRS